jgi:molecular chaperone DnaJ
LTLELPVSIREATLGARIDVPTLDGRATLTIPPGTHSGTRLRLRGKGIAARDGSAGDLLVRVQIRVPRDLDAEAKAAIETLERFEDAAIRKELFS